MAKQDESTYFEDYAQVDALEEFAPRIRQIQT